MLVQCFEYRKSPDRLSVAVFLDKNSYIMGILEVTSYDAHSCNHAAAERDLKLNSTYHTTIYISYVQ